MDNPVFCFSPESKLSDIRALLDSYAVEVRMGDQVYFRGPLHCCTLGKTRAFDTTGVFPAIDWRVEVRLIRYQPPVDLFILADNRRWFTDTDFLAGIRDRETRWPFFVLEPLSIRIMVGDQWWLYEFTTGKKYLERVFER